MAGILLPVISFQEQFHHFYTRYMIHLITGSIDMSSSST